MKSGIDQDALITMFAEASAKQGESAAQGGQRGDAARRCRAAS